MFFCQLVGFQQANCADLPLCLPVITDGGPPILGVNHFVGFRWSCADNFGAISKGTILTDRCLDGLNDSFHRASLPVHEVTPAALSTETLGMRIIFPHSVCGQTDQLFFRLGSAIASRGALFLLDSLYKFVAKHWMSRGTLWDSLKCDLRADAGPLSLFTRDWTNCWCPEVCCANASEKKDGRLRHARHTSFSSTLWSCSGTFSRWRSGRR